MPFAFISLLLFISLYIILFLWSFITPSILLHPVVLHISDLLIEETHNVKITYWS